MLPAPVFSICILAICCPKPLVPGLTKTRTRRLPVALLGRLAISLWRPTIPLSLWLAVTIAGWWLPIAALTAIRILAVHGAGWPIRIFLSIALLVVTGLIAK